METNRRVKLTFFCELGGRELEALFSDPSILSTLLELEAGISLGIRDLSARRARVVSRLNQAGIPVVAWQLLPRSQGYWFNICNAPQAQARYRAFRAWSTRHGLRWAGIGVDIEPDIVELEHLMQKNWRWVPVLLRRGCGKQRLVEAQTCYRSLVAGIRGDGFEVESYELPFVIDELRAGSTLLRRIVGITDVPADRRVPMLYTSYFRPYGQALLWQYARHADSMGVGITGGGVEMSGVGNHVPLSWEELARDLRLSAHWCRGVHIFSLEGCVRQGYLERLRDFDWDRPAYPPKHWLLGVILFRAGLQAALWLCSHPVPVALTLAAALLAWYAPGG